MIPDYKKKKNEFLKYVIVKTNSNGPTQLLLYYFDPLNIDFLLKYTRNKLNKDSKINITSEYIIEQMIDIYTMELMTRNSKTPIEFVEDANKKLINKTTENVKSMETITEYRHSLYNPKVCDYPKCSNGLLL